MRADLDWHLLSFRKLCKMCAKGEYIYISCCNFFLNNHIKSRTCGVLVAAKINANMYNICS